MKTPHWTKYRNIYIPSKAGLISSIQFVLSRSSVLTPLVEGTVSVLLKIPSFTHYIASSMLFIFPHSTPRIDEVKKPLYLVLFFHPKSEPCANAQKVIEGESSVLIGPRVFSTITPPFNHF